MRARPTIAPQRSAVIALRARQMRHALTPSETVLWSRLKSRQLGVVFHRQVPVGRFIARMERPVKVAPTWGRGVTQRRCSEPVAERDSNDGGSL